MKNQIRNSAPHSTNSDLPAGFIDATAQWQSDAQYGVVTNAYPGGNSGGGGGGTGGGGTGGGGTGGGGTGGGGGGACCSGQGGTGNSYNGPNGIGNPKGSESSTPFLITSTTVPADGAFSRLAEERRSAMRS